nr:reticuline oxidase-like protein [Ipomoea batatas]
MAKIPSNQTAFPHRAGILFKIQYAVNWNEKGAAADQKYNSQISDLHSFMTPFISSNPRQAFLNYRDIDVEINHHGAHSYEERKVYGERYFRGNFERFVTVKSKVDPHDFFRNAYDWENSSESAGNDGRDLGGFISQIEFGAQFISFEVIKNHNIKLPANVILRDEKGKNWNTYVKTWSDGRTWLSGEW